MTLVLALPAGAAERKPRFRTLGPGMALNTDGRYAAWWQPRGLSPYGPTALFDSADGGVRTLATPEGCSSRVRLGTGRLIWTCGRAPQQAQILDLQSGAVTSVAPDPHSGAYGVEWTDAGSAWVEASSQGYHYSGAPSYYNVGDGSIVYPEHWRTDAVPDVDRHDLWQPLCPGVTRSTYLDEESDDYPTGYKLSPFVYEAPYAVESDGRRVTLQRCGGRPPIVLGTAARTAFDLRGGLAAWANAKRVAVREGRTRKVTSWTLQEVTGRRVDQTPSVPYPSVKLTDTHLLVTITTDGQSNVFAVRRPDRLTRR